MSSESSELQHILSIDTDQTSMLENVLEVSEPSDFLFYTESEVVDRLREADPRLEEATVRSWYGTVLDHLEASFEDVSLDDENQPHEGGVSGEGGDGSSARSTEWRALANFVVAYSVKTLNGRTRTRVSAQLAEDLSGDGVEWWGLNTEGPCRWIRQVLQQNHPGLFLPAVSAPQPEDEPLEASDAIVASALTATDVVQAEPPGAEDVSFDAPERMPDDSMDPQICVRLSQMPDVGSRELSDNGVALLSADAPIDVNVTCDEGFRADHIMVTMRPIEGGPSEIYERDAPCLQRELTLPLKGHPSGGYTLYIWVGEADLRHLGATRRQDLFLL